MVDFDSAILGSNPSEGTKKYLGGIKLIFTFVKSRMARSSKSKDTSLSRKKSRSVTGTGYNSTVC